MDINNSFEKVTGLKENSFKV